MAFRKKTYKRSRKTYRRKRTFKRKRTYRKKRSYATRPYDSRKEDEMQNVTFTSSQLIESHFTNPSNSNFIAIYWACNANASAALTGDANLKVFTWDTTGAVERGIYTAQYASKKINWVRYRFIPSKVQFVPLGGGGESVVPATWDKTILCHYPGLNGTNGPLTVGSHEQYCVTSPQIKRIRPGAGFSGKINSARYCKQQSNFEPWVSGSATAQFTSDAGCTVIRMDYNNYTTSTNLGTMYVDYNITFKGRIIGIP